MASTIQSLPTLRGKVAENFIKVAEENLANNRGKVQFADKIAIAHRILSKAKFNR